jgi:hypothetical protein
VGVVPGEAAGGEVGVQQEQAGLDAQHLQGIEAERQDAVAADALAERVPHGESVAGRRPDLVAQVAGEPGAADRDRRAGDLAGGHAEVREGSGRGDEPRQQLARARPLQRQHAVLVADVLEPHVQPPDAVGEPGEVRLGAGQEVLVRRRVQHHAVLDDEAAVV